jgi:predicted nucleic acid-binding protein
LVETYSVLTRLPAPHRLAAADAQQLLDRRFGSRVLVPSAQLTRNIVVRLAEAGVTGGATYDGIVALTTAEHGAQLVTRDIRAAATYESLGVSFELVEH